MIQPQDILEFAITINNSACSETEYRAVVGRAYYAAYHKALDKVNRRPGGSQVKDNSEKSNVHAKLINHYRNSHNDKQRLIGRTLSKLREMRNSSDYDLSSLCERDDASDAIEKAEAIFKYC